MTTEHAGVSCDLCGTSPVRGVRYKCAACPNYDVCEGCVLALEASAAPAHPRAHAFLRLRFPVPVEVSTPPALQNRAVYEHPGVACGACGGAVLGWRAACVPCGVTLCEPCEACGRHPWGREHPRTRVLGQVQAPPGGDCAGLAGVAPERASAGGPASPARFGAALNPLGARLLAALAAEVAGRDVLVCPVSVAAALSLVAAGALPRSPVGAAMDALLACGDAGADAAAWLAAWGSSAAAAASEATLVLANSAWVATCVQPSYVQRVTAAFGAHVEPLTGADPINAWVAAATRGLINTVINGPLPPTLRFVLVNAVYFKAIWSAPFRRTATVRGRFRALGGGEGTPCALMFRFLDSSCAPGTVVADAPGLGSLVALPYGRSGRFRAVFVLPEAPGAAALDALLQPAALNTLLARALPPPGAAAGVTGDVELFLPRFHAEFGTHDLKPALSSLGLGAAFDPWAAPPCFARMSDEQVYVSSVLHKVVVDVNEEGTEAAAVTLTGFTACAIMSRPRPRRLTFDRPFAMLILDAASHAHAGAQPLLLFGGRVVRPSFDASGTHGEYAEPR